MPLTLVPAVSKILSSYLVVDDDELIPESEEVQQIHLKLLSTQSRVEGIRLKENIQPQDEDDDVSQHFLEEI